MKKSQKGFSESNKASLDKTENDIQIPRKYEYCINKKVSFELLKNEFVGILLDPHSDVEGFCRKVKKIMKYDLIPKRPGRSFKRIRKRTCRKYHMNQR